MPHKSKKTISLVLPVYNEVEILPYLIAELQKQLAVITHTYEYELIFVDDGSQDGSARELKTYHSVLPHILIELSRNFGHQAALLAGLKAAKGDMVITMDSDLQHPPAFIHHLISAAEEGNEIVFTKRDDNSSVPTMKRVTSTWFYKGINLFSPTNIPESSSDFRLMTRTALDALLLLPEKRIFLRGMVSWIGFRSKTLTYKANPRKKGTSKYNLLKMLQLALNGVSSFTTAPLYFSALIGLLFSLATILYGAYVAYIRFVVNDAVAGWSSVIFVLLGMGSILSFLLTIIGIYVAALYDETKQRPIYIIKK